MTAVGNTGRAVAVCTALIVQPVLVVLVERCQLNEDGVVRAQFRIFIRLPKGAAIERLSLLGILQEFVLFFILRLRCLRRIQRTVALLCIRVALPEDVLEDRPLLA